MALRSLHQSYEIPVARLVAIDMKASAKKRRAFMRQWDAVSYTHLTLPTIVGV